MFPKTGIPWNHYIHTLTQGTWICWRQWRAFIRQRPFASFKKREPFKVVVPITSKSKRIAGWIVVDFVCSILIVLTTSQQSHNNSHNNIHDNRFVWYRVILFHSLSDQVAPQRIHTWASKHILNSWPHEVPADSIVLPFSVHGLLCQASSRLFLLDFQGHFSKATRSEDCSLPAKTARSWTGSRCEPQKRCCFLFKHKNYTVYATFEISKSCFQGTTEPRYFWVSAPKEAKDGKYACKFSTA